jgi:hypothetical protein
MEMSRSRVVIFGNGKADRVILGSSVIAGLHKIRVAGTPNADSLRRLRLAIRLTARTAALTRSLYGSRFGPNRAATARKSGSPSVCRRLKMSVPRLCKTAAPFQT